MSFRSNPYDMTKKMMALIEVTVKKRGLDKPSDVIVEDTHSGISVS